MSNGNKNTVFVEANVINISAKFQLHPPYGFRGDDFLNIFSQIKPFGCQATKKKKKKKTSAVWTTFICLVEDYSRNNSVNFCQNICSEIAINAHFHFSQCKSMVTLSCHSNQSSYPIGIKTQLFVPLAYRYYMWNLVRIGFMASEERSFENADVRTTDAWLYYKLTEEHSAQVS